jgi:peptide/nickel transport system permease protein
MSDLESSGAPIDLQYSRRGRIRLALRRVMRSWDIMVGAAILLTMITLAIAAPLITSYDPVAIVPPDRLIPPNHQHLFGTDNFGRDIFSRVLYGGRLSIQVGLVSVALASITGTAIGLVAGYYGRWIDALLMRIIDVMLSFPSILLALAIVAVLGRSLSNVMLAIGIATIPVYARIARGSTLSVKEIDYVTAAHAIGTPTRRILTQHILPNVLAPLIVITTNGIAGAIIAGAALSFLGLGAQPPTPEWGIMLSDGRVYLRTAWWVTTFPGLAIMVTVLAINLLGDGLRDVLDPRLKI